MAASTALAIHLRLGRVSNLPTVWTNVLAGTVLATAPVAPWRLVALGAALSLFYEGGMYLNDAFDREIDARERPERPIPAGLVGARSVFALGFAMLAAGVVLVALLAALSPAEGAGAGALAGLALAAVIVYYDARHKRDPLSPLVMGLCRVLVYVTAALVASGRLGAALLGGAGALLAYLIGLTYVARQETLAEVRTLWPLLFLAAPFAYAADALGRGPWPALLYLVLLAWVVRALSLLVRRRGRSIPGAVSSLLAGISLLDALLIARAGALELAGLALLGFAVTLLLQRRVPAT